MSRRERIDPTTQTVSVLITMMTLVVIVGIVIAVKQS